MKIFYNTETTNSTETNLPRTIKIKSKINTVKKDTNIAEKCPLFVIYKANNQSSNIIQRRKQSKLLFKHYHSNSYLLYLTKPINMITCNLG